MRNTRQQRRHGAVLARVDDVERAGWIQYVERDRLVGFAHMERATHVQLLVVVPTEWRRGIGRAILNDLATSSGAKTASAGTLEGLALLLSCGWKKTGELDVEGFELFRAPTIADPRARRVHHRSSDRVASHRPAAPPFMARGTPSHGSTDKPSFERHASITPVEPSLAGGGSPLSGVGSRTNTLGTRTRAGGSGAKEANSIVEA